jgi:hypothetical protein
VHTLDWRDDPRIGTTIEEQDVWEKAKLAEIGPVAFASEYSRSYLESLNTFISYEAILACVDLHIRMNVRPTGARFAGFDPSDGGKDSAGLVILQGGMVTYLAEYRDRRGEQEKTVGKVFAALDDHRTRELQIDYTGIGSSHAVAAQNLNKTQERGKDGQRPYIKIFPFMGGEKPIDPEKPALGTGGEYTWEEFVTNRKGQGWQQLKVMTDASLAASKGLTHDPNQLLFLPSALGPLLQKLLNEVAQVCIERTASGKIQICKKGPTGQLLSPNLADSLVLAVAYRGTPMSMAGLV